MCEEEDCDVWEEGEFCQDGKSDGQRFGQSVWMGRAEKRVDGKAEVERQAQEEEDSQTTRVGDGDGDEGSRRDGGGGEGEGEGKSGRKGEGDEGREERWTPDPK